MQYNHTIDLDMMRRQSVEIVTHQYDDAGRAVRIRVLADGEPATLPANAQITYSVSKPDGTFCTGACTKEVDGEDTYVVFKLSYQMLILPGRETIDISIRADNASISTMTFINHIMRAAVQADDIESSSEFGQLEIALQGMDEIRDLKEDAEQAVADAQAVVDGIQSDRTQITTNKTDIAQLKEDLSHIEGISDEVKQALLACFRGVAWLDWKGSGESLYNALEEALYNEPAPDPRIVYEIPQGTDISTWAIDTKQHAYTLDEDFTILAKASIDMSSQESGVFLLDSLSRTASNVGCRLQSGLSNNAVNFTATFNQGSMYGGIGGTTSNTFSKSTTHNVIFIMTNYNKYMTVAIYVDGNIELQSSNTLTDKEGAVYPPTYYIGMHQGGVVRPWPGTVDLFRIYNEVLSNNEINEILGLE